MPGEKDDHVLWKLESKQKDITIKYITHYAGRPYPSTFSEGITYELPVKVNSTKLVAAIGMKGNKAISNPVYETFHFSKATGKKITLTTPPSKSYPGDGAFTLVNGVQNEKGLAKRNEFLGFSGADCEAIIDLGKEEKISTVTVHTLHQKSSWIWRPLTAEVHTSTDGSKYEFAGLTDDFNVTIKGLEKGKMKLSFEKKEARFVKIIVKCWEEIPAGEPGAGKRPWLFIDEIELN